MAGVPAHPVSTFEELANRLEATTRQLPWANLIGKRERDFDPEMEPTLVKQRVKLFYETGLQPK